MDHEFIVDGTVCKVSLQDKEGETVATVNGRQVRLDAQQVSSHSFSLLMHGKSYLAIVARDGESILVNVGTSQFRLDELKQESTLNQLRAGTPGKVEGTVKAPMPGLVIKINVAEGEKVNAGAGLVVVEAMKMEHEMRADFAASVEKVYVRAGELVDAFQPLVELKPLGDSGVPPQD